MWRRDRKFAGVYQSADVNFASGSRTFYLSGTGYNSKAGSCTSEILRTRRYPQVTVRAVTLAISCALSNGWHSNVAISRRYLSFWNTKRISVSPLFFHSSVSNHISLFHVSYTLNLSRARARARFFLLPFLILVAVAESYCIMLRYLVVNLFIIHCTVICRAHTHTHTNRIKLLWN